MPVLATIGGASSRGFGEFYPAGAGGSFIVATGGTTADDGNYRYHTFNSSGTFAVSAWPAGKYVDFLVVGGGGAGDLAGGGAGGLVVKESISGSTGSYAVTVGAGGASNPGAPVGTRAGGDSVFLGYTAIGGGGGADNYGGAGGSGGGGFFAGGAGLQPTSSSGGLGNAGSADAGGGAGGAPSGSTAGIGYSGSPLSSSTFAAGAAALDGAGTANTGNGGGSGENGGSGIVIIRYLFQ